MSAPVSHTALHDPAPSVIPPTRPGTPHPARRGSNPHFGGLIWTLVRTDFKTRYHATLGGFAWALLKPLAMFLVLWTVFSFIFHQDPNYRLNLILGLFLYDFFTDCTKTGLTALRMKGYLLTKAKFPSWIVVVTSTSNAIITLFFFTIATITLAALDVGVPSLADVGLVVLYEVCLFLITIGFSLAASVLFLKYRDLNQVWEVVTQAGFFVAPIVYPLGILPERVHFYIYMWPPTPIMQFARAVLVDRQVPTPLAHIYLLTETAVVLLVGWLIYSWHAPRAPEYL